MDYIHSNWQNKLKRKRLTSYQYNLNDSQLVPLTDDSPNWQCHFSHADVVIEAVFEDLELKKRTVDTVEQNTQDHCVFATNTSAIPISDTAQGSRRPENIIGMIEMCSERLMMLSQQ